MPYKRFNSLDSVLQSGSIKGFGDLGNQRAGKMNMFRAAMDAPYAAPGLQSYGNVGMDVESYPSSAIARGLSRSDYYGGKRNPSNSATHKVVTETKVFDVDNPAITVYHPVSGYSLTTTGAVALIFYPRVFTGASTSSYDNNNRVGRKTYCKSIFIRGQIFSGVYGSGTPLGTAATVIAPCCARLVVLYDKQPTQTSTLPTIAQIMESASSTSFMDFDSRERFYFVWDKIFALGGAYMDLTTRKLIESEGRHSYLVEKFIKCNLKTVFYAEDNTNTTPTATTNVYNADIKTGGIYLLSFSNIASVTNYDARADLDIRTRFLDCT